VGQLPKELVIRKRLIEKGHIRLMGMGGGLAHLGLAGPGSIPNSLREKGRR